MEIYDENGILQQMAGAGGASNLDGLSDVVITAAAQGDILTRDGTDWDNVNIGQEEVVARLTGGNVDGLAMGASTVLARLAAGGIVAATVAQIKTLLALAVADVTNAAHTALNNLASVAINTSLISDTDNTDDLGSSATKWASFFGLAAVLEERAAPGTPAAGDVVLYAKTDGLLYSKDDAGAETLVSGGAGSGSGPSLLYANSTTVSVVSTITETDLLSFSLDANTLGTNDWVEIRIPVKILLTSGGGGVVFKLKLGATTIVSATSAAYAGAVTGYGTLVAWIKGDGATNAQLGVLAFEGGLNANPNHVGVANTGTATEDSTGALTLAVSADPQINSAACGAVGYGGYAQHITV